MIATRSKDAAILIEENVGVFDVVILEQSELGAEIPEVIQSVRSVEPSMPVFVISEDADYIHANRRLLPDSVYLCQELDPECVDHMIDSVGLSSRVKMDR